jgi:hypothetical protein
MDESKAVVDSGTAQDPTPAPAPAVGSAIDIEKLAEKVYQLMRAEARLSRVRGDKRSTRR